MSGRTAALDWEARFRAERTPWERPSLNPAFVGLARRRRAAPCRILLPGAGRSGEPLALARDGFDVTVVDLAPTAAEVQRVRLHAAGLRGDRFQADLLAWEPDAPFDAVYDQTCLCALPPAILPDYVGAPAPLAAAGRLAVHPVHADRLGGRPALRLPARPDAHPVRRRLDMAGAACRRAVAAWHAGHDHARDSRDPDPGLTTRAGPGSLRRGTGSARGARSAALRQPAAPFRHRAQPVIEPLRLSHVEQVLRWRVVHAAHLRPRRAGGYQQQHRERGAGRKESALRHVRLRNATVHSPVRRGGGVSPPASGFLDRTTPHRLHPPAFLRTAAPSWLKRNRAAGSITSRPSCTPG